MGRPTMLPFSQAVRVGPLVDHPDVGDRRKRNAGSDLVVAEMAYVTRAGDEAAAEAARAIAFFTWL